MFNYLAGNATAMQQALNTAIEGFASNEKG
jgi:hypothetical protein